MSTASFLRLIALSAIWGGSFLFMRIAAPVVGPAWLVFGRVGFAALFLFALAITLSKQTKLARDWKHFSIVAFFNSALPFFLFSFAALTLSTSQLAVLNATAPAWGYLIGICLRNESFSWQRLSGIVMGVLGVYLIFSTPGSSGSGDYYVAVAACLMASCCYAIATNYAKKSKGVEPFSNAYGSMVYSALIVAPALIFFPMRSEPTIEASLAILAIGVICSGIAYLLYFRLISDVGATSALSVTFLIPLFGTLWGVLLLGESVTLRSVSGMLVVILGTALVTSFNPKSLIKAK